MQPGETKVQTSGETQHKHRRRRASITPSGIPMRRRKHGDGEEGGRGVRDVLTLNGESWFLLIVVGRGDRSVFHILLENRKSRRAER